MPATRNGSTGTTTAVAVTRDAYQTRPAASFRASRCRGDAYRYTSDKQQQGLTQFNHQEQFQSKLHTTPIQRRADESKSALVVELKANGASTD